MPLAAIARSYSFEERIQRAQHLRAKWPFAAEVLSTYELIAQFQQSLTLTLRNCSFNGHSYSRLPPEINFSPLLQEFQSLLLVTAVSAPETVAASAQTLSDIGAGWEDSLQAYWAGTYDGNDDARTFLLHAFLQPIAEHFSRNAELPAAKERVSVCPFCARRPACGILRAEGDGAKRSLLCSFCSTEWEYRRLVCPACEQEDVEKLPVYTAEQFSYIRIEACDACHSFTKTIDLSKDGRAIPAVDEIASLPLTLWAQQRGYRKLQTNLLLM